MALYTGHVPEIFRGMRRGSSSSADDDAFVCGAEGNPKGRSDRLKDVRLENASVLKPSAKAALISFDKLKRRCSRTLWARYRDSGYLTTDYMVTSSSLGYFKRCLAACEELRMDGEGGGRLLTVAPIFHPGSNYSSASAGLPTGALRTQTTSTVINFVRILLTII